MPTWLNGIGSKVGSLIGTRTPMAYFGAFGKHPGWNDHLDDLGLDSEPLIAAKQYLYFKGIQDVINAGQWKALTDEEALAGFRHVFVWKDERDLLVGKLWSSSDGKDRTEYPMVVCAHFADRTSPGVPNAIPLLDQLEVSCHATKSADEVRQLVAGALRSATLLLESAAPAEPSRAKIAASLGLEPSSEAAARIAYCAENQFAPLAASGVGKAQIGLKLGEFKGPAPMIRLPALPGQPLASQRFWQEFLSDDIPAGAPQLYLAPVAAPWIDVIVGLPTARQLFCLRAGEKAMPTASLIPFNVTESAREATTARWRKFLAGN